MRQSIRELRSGQGLVRSHRPYYVVAVAVALNERYQESHEGPPNEDEVRNSWWVDQNHQDGPTDLLDDKKAYDAAISICHKQGLISALTDEFGPDIYQYARDFPGTYRMFQDHVASDLFRKYQTGGRTWLVSALRKILNTPADQREPKAPTGEWEPIPLDRNSANLQKATEALDRAIEVVRADNGYAANEPEEQRFVLDKLRAVRKRLKEDAHISWMYLNEFALKPLLTVVDRFGKAATGIAAKEARDALVKWVKERAGDILGELLK
jgi:hypothetical protein